MKPEISPRTRTWPKALLDRALQRAGQFGDAERGRVVARRLARLTARRHVIGGGVSAMNVLLHRIGRARTCAGVEAGAIAAARQALRRARQSRHRRACRAASRSTPPIIAAVLAFCAATDDRAGRDRPRGAAGRRPGRHSARDGHRRCSGPSAAAAQLEGSKGFTKDLCARANIPTAAYARFADSGDGAWPRSTTSACRW